MEKLENTIDVRCVPTMLSRNCYFLNYGGSQTRETLKSFQFTFLICQKDFGRSVILKAKYQAKIHGCKILRLLLQLLTKYQIQTFRF